MSERTTLAAAATALLVAACATPVRDLDARQIQALDDLEELMYVNATVAEPRFELASKLRGETPTEAQWAEFTDMGRRLQMTARQGLRFSKGEGFDAYLRELADKAVRLEAAVVALQAEQTYDLALDIQATCKACHRDFR